jgi:hypothetical protein
MNDAIEVLTQPATGHVMVLLIGVLSMQTMAATRTRLVELLGASDCVVVDLSGLHLRHPGCVAIFTTAVEQAGGWPHAKLALIGADPRMLTHLSSRGIDTAVPVADSLNAALAMTDLPPRPRTSSTNPAPSPVAAIARMNPAAAQFVQDWLGVLIEHDQLGRSELVATLATFLQHNCDYHDTARALGIHRSTARYRIHRIAQLTQLDLHDPEIHRHLHAATRIFDRLSDAPER